MIRKTFTGHFVLQMWYKSRVVSRKSGRMYVGGLGLSSAWAYPPHFTVIRSSSGRTASARAAPALLAAAPKHDHHAQDKHIFGRP